MITVRKVCHHHRSRRPLFCWESHTQGFLKHNGLVNPKFTSTGATINPEHYVGMLQKLKASIYVADMTMSVSMTM
jgi:hypothetical protein